MALSKAEREELAEEARATGKDPAAFLAAAERADEAGGASPGSGGGNAGKAAEGARATHPNGVEVNAYHFPFLRVNEIRALYGYESAPDGEMFSGAWLAKHGGPAKPTDPSTTE